MRPSGVVHGIAGEHTFINFRIVSFRYSLENELRRNGDQQYQHVRGQTVMAPRKRQRTRIRQEDRKLSVRPVRRAQIDIKKLSHAVIAIALARAKAEAEAEAADREQMNGHATASTHGGGSE